MNARLISIESPRNSGVSRTCCWIEAADMRLRTDMGFYAPFASVAGFTVSELEPIEML